MTALAGVEAAEHASYVSVAEGAAAARGAAAALDALAGRCGAPVTGRATWLLSALESASDAEPVVVCVHGETGAVHAAAALVRGEVAGQSALALAGTGEGYLGWLLADGPEPARRLAIALAEVVYRGRVRRVRLGPVAPGDPVLATLQSLLAGSRVEPAPDIPAVRRHGSAAAADYLDPAVRRNLRKARNRLARDGVPTEVTFLSDEWAAMRLLPSMVRAFRDRDHAQGVGSPLDDPAGRRAWRARVVRLLREAGGELGLLRIDGRLAAYVLAVHDGPAYRVVEGRFAADFGRYSPDRLLEAAVLQRMLDDPRKQTLDWMTGTAPQTLLAVNHRLPTERLTWIDPGPVARPRPAR